MMLTLLLCRQGFQLFGTKWNYLRTLVNLLDWFTYVTAVLVVIDLTPCGLRTVGYHAANCKVYHLYSAVCSMYCNQKYILCISDCNYILVVNVFIIRKGTASFLRKPSYYSALSRFGWHGDCLATVYNINGKTAFGGFASTMSLYQRIRISLSRPCVCVFVVVVFLQDWQWQLSAFCAFIAWMDLLLFLRRLPQVGIYVVMIVEIFTTFTKFFVVFFLFICAFALSFYILLRNQVGRPTVSENCPVSTRK